MTPPSHTLRGMAVTVPSASLYTHSDAADDMKPWLLHSLLSQLIVLRLHDMCFNSQCDVRHSGKTSSPIWAWGNATSNNGKPCTRLG